MPVSWPAGAVRLAPVPSTSPTVQRAPGGFPVVGVIGGGQLARMLAGPAIELGVQLSVLAEAPDASAALVIPSAPVGAHDDLDAVLAFARDCDVVTFDHEHVPAPVLSALQEAGVVLHPDPAALVFAQDKLAMRERLTALGIPCPQWTRATTREEVLAFGERVGWPIIAKTPRGGYDGKGVCRLAGPEDLAEIEGWLAAIGTDGGVRDGILLEEAVASPANWPSSSPAAPPDRPLPGRSSKRSRPTACAPT